MNDLAKMTRRLTIHKFGGTSLGDTFAIKEAIKIVRSASRQGEAVVVVSAMSGVTNKLIDAAKRSKRGEYSVAATLIWELRQRHLEVLKSLVSRSAERSQAERVFESVIREAENVCEEASLSGQLTAQKLDAISSLGERLSAPLLACVLNENRIASEPIVASDVIRTNSRFGCAEPIMEATTERCRLRLRPLLERGVVPVVTGFVGATEDGAVTTLGRGGSDYSATILGATLNADEVIIWTDVNGFMTADPRLVPTARTIVELSYTQATDMSRAGAKVLHPGTLIVLDESGIPVTIRNTFAAECPGTRIRKTTPSTAGAIVGVAVSENESGARITVVGCDIPLSGTFNRVCAALAVEKVNRIESKDDFSRHHISFVVSKGDLVASVNAIHTEFQLQETTSQVAAQNGPSIDPAIVGRSEAPVVAAAEQHV